jgi:hypothetical protein
MTLPKPPKPLPSFDPATRYPQDYQQGVDTANRVIDNRPAAVNSLLQLVTKHMETWPQVQGKNGLTSQQWARSAGFAHTLREYREAQGDA